MRSCQHLLNLCQCWLSDQHFLVEHQRNWISITRLNNQYVCQVTCCQHQIFIEFISDDQNGIQATQCFQFFRQQFCFRSIYSNIINHVQTTFTSQLREDRADTCAIHLFVNFVREVLIWCIWENTTTATPQRRGRHTSTCTTSTFLTPRLLSCVVDFFTIFLLAIAATSVRLECNNYLMNQGFVVITTENSIRSNDVRCSLTLFV